MKMIPGIFVLFLSVAGSLTPQIIKYSDSINVIVNSSVQFSCTGVGHGILYLVNSTSAYNFITRGFKQSNQEVLENFTIRRNLTLNLVTLDLNNTKIQCRIHVVVPPPNLSYATWSNVSILRVQGVLNVVHHVNFNFNSTSLNVTWSAPYTLDGVPILGYNITVTNTANGNILSTYFTQDTQYVISNNGDPCTELTLTISAYNGAGDGGATPSKFSYPGVPADYMTDLILSLIIINEKSAVELFVLLNISCLCPGQYPTNAYINIVNANGNTKGYVVSILEGNINDNFVLVLDARYTVAIILSNAAGNFSEISKTLTTFGVQNARLLIESNRLCVTCTLLPSPLGDEGCYVDIIGDTTSYSSCIVRHDNNTENITGCISDIDSGTYNVSIYDANNDCDIDVLSNTPATIYEHVDLSANFIASNTSSTSTTITNGTSALITITKSIASTINSTTIANGTSALITITKSSIRSSTIEVNVIISTNTVNDVQITSTGTAPDTLPSLPIILALAGTLTLVVLICALFVILLLCKRVQHGTTYINHSPHAGYNYDSNPSYSSRRLPALLAAVPPPPTIPLPNVPQPPTPLPDIPQPHAAPDASSVTDIDDVKYEEIHEYLQIIEGNEDKS